MARHGWSATSIALCCLGLGCEAAGGTKELGQPPDVLFLDAAETTFSSPFGASLRAAFGTVTLRDFAITGRRSPRSSACGTPTPARRSTIASSSS